MICGGIRLEDPMQQSTATCTQPASMNNVPWLSLLLYRRYRRHGVIIRQRQLVVRRFFFMHCSILFPPKVLRMHASIHACSFFLHSHVHAYLLLFANVRPYTDAESARRKNRHSDGDAKSLDTYLLQHR